MTMPGRPSAKALEFGRLYVEALSAWSELFAAASRTVEANVTLGEAYSSAADEFDTWMKQTAAGPFAWMSPDAMKAWSDTVGAAFTPPRDTP
jgi:hypothetical protein